MFKRFRDSSPVSDSGARRTETRGVHARGFTLIEVLIAVGIIAILVSIIAVSIKTVMSSSKTKATRATLENALGLQAEFEIAEKLDKVMAVPVATTDYWTIPAAPKKITHSTCSVSADATNRNLATARVMTGLAKMPKNRAALDAMSGGSLLRHDYPDVIITIAPNEARWGQPSGTASITLPSGTGSILADAWGNPILFVPGGGLTNVTAGDVSGQSIVAPENRPFWASAGPDGSFMQGDDNIYSFEN